MDDEPAILAVHRSTPGISPAKPVLRGRAVARRLLLQTSGLAVLWPSRLFAAERGAAPAASTPTGAPDPQATARQLLILGDSLSAEYGLGRGEGWVALLERRTGPKGWGVTNASISGETTSGGLSRLPSLLRRHRPAVTVIELGANDALRGLSLPATEANLRRMVSLAREAGSRPLLVGMMLPPNFGAAYANQFRDMFRQIAESEKAALVPFLLDGFADDMAWFQPDRIHPTARAQPRMLDNVWPVLSEML